MKSKGCQYSYGIIPIQRWKTEILSFDPYIALFYDFVTEKESNLIIGKASLKLEKALTGPDPRDFVLNTEQRLSKASWFEDASPSVFRRISHRIEQVTGLKAGYRAERSFGEAYQVVNYGIGGFYTPHYDFFKIDKAFKTAGNYLQDSGDRAATFMVYLGNVTSGGATVFPRLGIGTPPIKNAALFWNNFAPENGLRDERTLHGGCPVISGHKWVTNKWIHEISTAMIRSCRKESSVKENAS
ncbi:prolyl 4-hydroxylase subunit alpha-3-like [Pomacea canaliculata]|uniref:prolyl 4-hydroxylase subunit alpha-3-like n=1 Tax=Pomacea canaliculata TaxID=400727 RepID=UPI000D728FA3|nr:prolyl 4-hydroxylase subunit alpha-3-like [Pomacea canaliculata]